MALPGEIGWIGKNCPDHPNVPLISGAMKSAAGWFIGTYCHLCRHEDPSPHSRETDYYPTKFDLVQEAFDGTVKWRDTQFRGLKLLVREGPWQFQRDDDAPTDCFAVICPEHGRVFLSQAEYNRQLWAAEDLWTCPTCRAASKFDDETYERAMRESPGGYCNESGRFDG